ncbi:MAG: hypothetical protein K9W42_06705 [Candidatus Heimdallarchaeota archaeon]|nr:hypothetical protein [Candidatus Heimdallarchaeota archaeon]
MKKKKMCGDNKHKNSNQGEESMVINNSTEKEEIEEKKEKRKEKVRKVFVYIGVLCLIGLLVGIPVMFYFVR